MKEDQMTQETTLRASEELEADAPGMDRLLGWSTVTGLALALVGIGVCVLCGIPIF